MQSPGEDEAAVNQLFGDILYGGPDDPECNKCHMTPIGCDMAGCGNFTEVQPPTP